jgi:hypothetical protein
MIAFNYFLEYFPRYGRVCVYAHLSVNSPLRQRYVESRSKSELIHFIKDIQIYDSVTLFSKFSHRPYHGPYCIGINTK